MVNFIVTDIIRQLGIMVLVWVRKEFHELVNKDGCRCCRTVVVAYTAYMIQTMDSHIPIYDKNTALPKNLKEVNADQHTHFSTAAQFIPPKIV